MTVHKVSRRSMLLGAAGVAGAALLAACGGETTTSGATTAPNATAAAPGTPRATAVAPTAAVAPTSVVGMLPNKVVEIDYWHRSTGDAAKAFETLAADFNAQYMGKIKVTPVAQGSIADLNKKVRAAATGGGLPGALMGDDYDVTQYAYSKIIVPIDPYIEDPTHGLTMEQRADFLPNQIGRHKLPIYDNRTVAFPQGFSAFTTFWNVDALQKAGFSGPPKTWKEFPDHARAVAKANPGMATWYIGGAGDRFISVLMTYGVEWLKPDSRESNFDAPEALEIMTWWKQLYDEKLLDIPKESARDLFVARKAAYFMDSSASSVGLAPLVKDFQWNAALPPQGANSTKMQTETYGPVNAIPKTDPEKQLAGWLWLKWLTTPQPIAKWIAATSYFPATKAAVDGPDLKEFYTKYPVASRLVKEVAPVARILAPSPALTEVRGQVVANVVNEVLLGQLTPEAGVRKMKAEADKAIRNALQN